MNEPKKVPRIIDEKKYAIQIENFVSQKQTVCWMPGQEDTGTEPSDKDKWKKSALRVPRVGRFFYDGSTAKIDDTPPLHEWVEVNEFDMDQWRVNMYSDTNTYPGKYLIEITNVGLEKTHCRGELRVQVWDIGAILPYPFFGYTYYNLIYDGPPSGVPAPFSYIHSSQRFFFYQRPSRFDGFTEYRRAFQVTGGTDFGPIGSSPFNYEPNPPKEKLPHRIVDNATAAGIDLTIDICDAGDPRYPIWSYYFHGADL